jgi:serine/threonine protein kinase
MQLSTGDSVGRYHIERLIGKGGFASVFLADDSVLRRRVALKVNHRDDVNDSERWLLNEARILAELKHPSIVNIFDVGRVGRHEEWLYLVLEYLDGGTLRDTLERNEGTQLAHKRVIDIAVNVADALDYAHRRGYLHRDIKPANILQDSTGQPRLTGFELGVQTEELASAEWGVLRRIWLQNSSLASSDRLAPTPISGDSE